MAKFLSLAPTMARRGFLVITFIQSIIVLAFVGRAFKLVNDSPDSQGPLSLQTLSCYLAFFIVFEIFELAIALEACWFENNFQLLSILLFHLGSIVLSAIHVREIQAQVVLTSLTDWQCYQLAGPDACQGSEGLHTRMRPLLIAIPCLLLVGWFGMVFFANNFYSEFKSNWKGITYQVTLCPLKYTFISFVGVLSQVLVAQVPKSSKDFAQAMSAIPVALVLLLMFILAVPRTTKWLTITFVILMVAWTGYLEYLIKDFFNHTADIWYLPIGQTNVTFFIVLSVLSLYVAAVMGYLSLR